MDFVNKMMWKTLFLLCLKMTVVLSAPFQFPLLQPMQGTLEQQRLALQEQMFALQQFQALQSMNAIPSVAAINNPPILLIYPNIDKAANIKTIPKEKQKTGYEDNDSNSIVIDSDNELNDDNNPIDNNLNQNKEERVKAVILVPNARGIIGDLITGIPFLPIEVNVPDSIAWIYKWFSDLIAGWGQGRQTEMMWRRMQMNQNRPVMMIPWNQPYF